MCKRIRVLRVFGSLTGGRTYDFRSAQSARATLGPSFKKRDAIASIIATAPLLTTHNSPSTKCSASTRPVAQQQPSGPHPALCCLKNSTYSQHNRKNYKQNFTRCDQDSPQMMYRTLSGLSTRVLQVSEHTKCLAGRWRCFAEHKP